MKLAVIQTGGKQYIVSEGDILKIEKLATDSKKGDKITFDKVLLLSDAGDIKIGTPYLDKSQVEASIIEIGRSEKIRVIKYKQKSRYFKKRGHRQPYLKVKISSVK